jgi:hypothetical protein
LKKPSGILAIHITNTYLDLRPVVFAAARHLKLQASLVRSAGDGRIISESNWVLLSSGGNLPQVNTAAGGDGETRRHAGTISPWTDDYSNLIQILNR